METYTKIIINGPDDLPKQKGEYYVACFGSNKDLTLYTFDKSNKENKDFWNGSVDWYLIPQEQKEQEIIKALSGEDVVDIPTFTSTDYKEPIKIEEILTILKSNLKISIGSYEGDFHNHNAEITGMEDVAQILVDEFANQKQETVKSAEEFLKSKGYNNEMIFGDFDMVVNLMNEFASQVQDKDYQLMKVDRDCAVQAYYDTLAELKDGQEITDEEILAYFSNNSNGFMRNPIPIPVMSRGVAVEMVNHFINKVKQGKGINLRGELIQFLSDSKIIIWPAGHDCIDIVDEYLSKTAIGKKK